MLTTKIRHLDLFAGIGGFSLAAERIGVSYSGMYSEIDKNAIKIYEHHFPNHKNLGDVTKLDLDDLENKRFNLITFGSPCQDLSIAKTNREGLKGSKSSLFYAAVDVLEALRPKYFIMENVYSMPRVARDNISKVLGVEPKMINSNYFTAQNRKRLYWSNIPFEVPTLNHNIKMKNLVAWSRSTRYPKDGGPSYVESRKRMDGKSNTLTTGKGCNSFSSKNFLLVDGIEVLLSPRECEILQGFNVGYTEGVSNTQRFKLLGNAVTPQVVRHILEGAKW